LGQWKQNTSTNNEEDQEVGEPEVLFTHSSTEKLGMAQLGDKGLEEGARWMQHTKNKINFRPLERVRWFISKKMGTCQPI
jgi:hypothetical protein